MVFAEKVRDHGRCICIVIAMVILSACGGQKPGSMAHDQSSRGGNTSPETGTFTPLKSDDAPSQTGINDPLAKLPTPKPLDPSDKTVKLYLYTPDPIVAMGRPDGYFLIGQEKLKSYYQDSSVSSTYTIPIPIDTFKNLHPGDSIVYTSAEEEVERNFGLFDPTTLKGQEQLQTRRMKLVDSLATLDTPVRSTHAKTKLAEIHRTMQVSTLSETWQTSATLKHSKTKAIFAADKEAIRSLLDMPLDTLTDDDQGSLKVYVDGIVKFDGLIVHQLLDLNTTPITDAHVWRTALRRRVAADVAYIQQDYLRALELYEEAWDLSIQAIN